MTKELKIIVGENSISTKIFIGDKQLGLVQAIKIDVKVNQPPRVEITFPDLRLYSSNLPNQLNDQIEELSHFPQVKIILQPLDFSETVEGAKRF